MAMQAGIDLGSRAIKVVVGKPKGPAFELHRAFALPVDLEGDGEAAILEAAQGLRSELGKAPGARFSVSGRELIIRYTKVPPVPVWRLRLLMDFEIREMAEQAGSLLASDYNLIAATGPDGDETVLVAVVKEPFLNARHQAVTDACGEPKAGMPASLALFNGWLQSGGLYEGEYVFLVDIGDRNVEIVLEKDGDLLFARNMATGGRDLTQAVAQTFRVGLEQAERIKEEYGNVTPKGLVSYTSGKEEQVANALIGPVGQLASMIQSSLAFARAQTGIRSLQASRILISGGGANLRGLSDYLKSAFGCPVERFQPESGLDLSHLPDDERAAFEADPGSFAVALGLAVSGSKEEAFIVDLVPESVKKKRVFRSRTLFSYAAAVVALAFLVMHYMDLSAELEETRVAARRAATEAGRQSRKRTTFEKLQSEINLQNERLRELDDETRRSWAVGQALQLVQRNIPDETWVELVDLVDREVPVNPEDPRSPKERRLLVSVTGTILSVKKQAEQSLQGMVSAIQKEGARAWITKIDNVEGIGAKQVEFGVDIDLFRKPEPATN
jgi:type IV pilus assembly protein PilM